MLKIEQEYPELYKYLDENPITIPSTGVDPISSVDMAAYLQSLEELLQHHIESHAGEPAH